MSFILDALRRAEAERERGKLPNLQAVPGPLPARSGPADLPGSTARMRHRVAWGLLAALGVSGFVAAVFWVVRSGQGPAVMPPVASAGPAAQNPAATRPADPGAAERGAVPRGATPPAPQPNPRTQPEPMPIVDAPQANAPATASPPATGPLTAPGATAAPAGGSRAVGAGQVGTSAQPPGADVQGPAAGKVTGVASGDAAPAAAPIAGTTSPPAVPPPSGDAPAADPATPGAIVTLAELPPALRSLVPPLSVSGSSFTEVRANRLLFLNGAMLREGDRLTPEIRLESIELRAAVLSVRGQRFRISF